MENNEITAEDFKTQTCSSQLSSKTENSNTNKIFSKSEKRNLLLYILAIMLYKFAFESIGVSISLFVLDRMNSSGSANKIWANLVILNGVAQAIGSIISGGLLDRFRPNRIMAVNIILMTVMIIIYNLLEVCYGGTITKKGDWNPWVIFLIYTTFGIFLGSFETCRRTISPKIIGVDVNKLKKMDSMVHIFYEIGGTIGAFVSAILINKLNYVYSTGSIIGLFIISAILYVNINISFSDVQESQKCCHNITLCQIVKNWGTSIKLGMTIVFTSRRFIWLIPCYVLPLVIHRLYENVMFPFYAKNILKEKELTGVMLSASNFGELLGALTVFILTNRVKTPIPWIRVDALMMGVMWSLVYIGNSDHPWKSVGILIPLIIPVSFGWAAGEVSLLAHIQSQLIHTQNNNVEESQKLNAVMSLLYSSYIVLITITANGIGILFDKMHDEPKKGLFYVAGIMMTCIAVIIFTSTWIPPKEKQSEQNKTNLNV